MKDKITGVILAAGAGTRMYPFSVDFPKPLLPICGKPLLVYQVEIMKSLGVEEIIIVIGHCGHEIAKIIGDGSKYGVSISYVEQRERLGIAHALGQLESFVNGPFILFLGDIYFLSDNFNLIVDEFKHGDIHCVLAAKHEQDKKSIMKNFSIYLNADGKTVKRVIEKPRYIENNLKGCGIYMFDMHIFDAIRRTPRTAMRNEYELTDSIQILIEDGFKAVVAPVIKEDINLTSPKDLHYINFVELKRRGKNVYVGEGCSINNKCTINNSIIGDNVHVENDIEIKDSIIFSNVRYQDKESLSGVIVTPSRTISVSNIH